MIKLRTMSARDIAALDPILMEAYQNPNSYKARLERLLALGPGDWLLAEREGRIVGSGGITVMGRVAYVGLVAVVPAERRQGVAGLIMEGLLEGARKRGCSTVLLDASAAGQPLYEKLGFVAEDDACLWKREEEAKEGILSGPEGMWVTSLAEENAARSLPLDSLPEELAGFDREALGWDRSRVLASFIADDPALVSLARDRSGRLRGFAVVQASASILGPWVANDPLAARALLRRALEDRERLPGMAYVPGANQDAAMALACAGFAPLRSNTHMRLGEALPHARRRLVYSQASFALG
jgi:GNAT superfamily N-acetyltransferase